MKPNIPPHKPKFAKKNQTTILPSKFARFMNDCYAIMFFASAFIMGLALFTYSDKDKCWSHSFNTSVTYNKLGIVGAYLSDLLYYLLGFSAWWLVLGLFYVGARKIMRNKITTGNWRTIYQTLSFLILILSSATFEYIIFYNTPSILPDSYGGVMGAFFVLSFYHLIGEIGIAIAVLFAMVISFSFTFAISWPYIAEKIGSLLESIYLKLTSAVERREDISPQANNSPVIVSNNVETSQQPFKNDDTTSRFQVIKDEYTDNLTDNELSEFGNHQVNFDNDVAIREDVFANDAFSAMDDKFIIDTDDNDVDFAIDNKQFFAANEDAMHATIDNEVNGFANLSNLDDFNDEQPVATVATNFTDFNQVPVPAASQRVNTVQASNVTKPNNTNKLPLTSLLNMPVVQPENISPENIAEVSRKIETTLADFGVEIKICNVESGPVITRYELIPPRGVKGDRIAGFAKDIARSLALSNVRIVENIVGKNTMGIEVPNAKRQTIYLKEIFDSRVYQGNNSLLTLALGKDISGQVIVTDLAKMPHLLVAGTTGSGKSVSVNAMILSILFNATADEVKFIMIDPKMVELSFYQDIPHLLAPVVTDMSQAANALKWTVGEMERRYKLMAKIGTKKITDFNHKIEMAEKAGRPLYNPFNPDLSNPEPLEKWPYIVVIIDELADLMMVAGKKIEQYIARIAQKARAVGIHLIVATQRPSVDVITGLIKANIPARIGFQVSSKIDSRTILDQQGAEALLGMGDMLFLNPGSGFPRRIHGAFVNDDELHQVVEFLKSQGAPNYNDEILSGEVDVVIPGVEDESAANDSGNIEKDTIFDSAVKFILESKRCSISSLQTQFGIGYNKAARIMNHLEKIGMVKRTERGTFELLHHTLS